MTPPSRKSTLLWLLLLGVVLLIGGLAARQLILVGRALFGDGTGRTSVDQAVVVARMRQVARLVSSETTLRDVVIYENRRLGSTKRSLVVVTGKILAGVDLDRGTEINIDQRERRISIVLPHAQVLGVEIMQLKTYDEQSGLLNPFRPADRDTVFRLARERLAGASQELGIVQHAERSAEQLLESLVNVDGYTTDVSFGSPRPPTARDD